MINKSKKEKISKDLLFLIAFFVATVSPWAITFSRAAWESNLATLFILLGINSFFLFLDKTQRDNKKGIIYLLFSVFSLVLASYTYHSARFIAPFTGLSLVTIYLVLQKKKSSFKALFSAFLLALLLMLPLILSFRTNVGQQRIAETSIFSDLSIIEKSNELKEAAGNTLFSRIIYHRYLLFAKEIVLNFCDHFYFDYLFVSGDINPRHSIQSFWTFLYI